jgi:hypothetical protein
VPDRSTTVLNASLEVTSGSAGTSPPALPTGAAGMTGWLRAIYDALAGAGGPSSSVTISQTTPGTTNGVVVNSSALPTGASTDSNNNTIAGAAGSSPPALASGASGLIGWLRKIVDTLTGGLAVTGTFWQTTQPVSGTFWQSTQPISASALPLPTGAAADATLTGGTQQTKLTDGTNVASVKAASTLPAATDKAVVVTARDSISVTGTFWQATQPVSGTFWQATQPVSGTFWQATQPVSGTVTANAGTNLNTSALALDATLTGGTQQSKITDGTNVATVKAASTAAGATDKAVVVAVSPNNTVGVTGTFWQATQPVSGTFWQTTQPISAASLPLPTGAALDATLTGGTARTKLTDGTNNAAVKAASTAAVAADPALVVAWSPNMGPSSNSLLPSAAATINATVVKASAGRLYKIKGYNAAAAVRYIKFWNKATTPAPASDTALIMFAYPLKASDQFDIDLTPIGFAFSTGIGYTISTGSANADATAVTAADIVGLNVMYA